MNVILSMLTVSLVCASALNALEKPEAETVPPSGFEPLSLKQILIKKIIKDGIHVPEGKLPADLTHQIKEEMLAGREIDFLALLKRIPTPRTKIATLHPNEQIISLSPNGKKLLAHHAEKLVFNVFDAESGALVSPVPKHCDCLTFPLHAFDHKGELLVCVARCHHVNMDIMEILRPKKKSTQTVLLPGFVPESIALNAEGTMLVCAGGCGGEIRMYTTTDHEADFALVRSFGAGHVVALSPDASKLATMNHGFVTVYDLEIGEPQKLYEAVVDLQVQSLKFSEHSHDLLALWRGLASKQPIVQQENSAVRLIELCVAPTASIASICFAHHGHKLVSLEDGVPQFSYYIEQDIQEVLQLELPPQERDIDPGKSNGKFLVMQLHDKDTLLTACTRNEVYRFDLKQLNQAELRFAKSIDDMAVDDVPVALALLKMNDYEYRNRANRATMDESESRVDQEIRKLITPQSTFAEGCGQSLIHRIQYPFLGAAGLFLAFCCLRN